MTAPDRRGVLAGAASVPAFSVLEAPWIVPPLGVPVAITLFPPLTTWLSRPVLG